MRKITVFFVVVFLNSCGGSDSQTQQETHAPNAEGLKKPPRQQAEPGSGPVGEDDIPAPGSNDAPLPPGGNRGYSEAVNQFAALLPTSKTQCLNRKRAITNLRRHAPSYERFVGHFKAHRKEISFFLEEARASSSKALHDKFVGYLESKLRGATRFDAFLAAEVGIEITKSGLPTATKLRRISKLMIDQSHDGFESLAQSRDEVVNCLQEVHRSLLQDHELLSGENHLTRTIARLRALKVPSLSLNAALTQGDQYLDDSIVQLNEVLDQLFAIYDTLVPGFFSEQ